MSCVNMLIQALHTFFFLNLREESLPETQWRWNLPGWTDNFSWPQFCDRRLPIRGVKLTDDVLELRPPSCNLQSGTGHQTLHVGSVTRVDS